MSGDNWGALTLVLMGFGVAASLPAWTATGRRIWAPATLALLVAAVLVAAVPDPATLGSHGATVALVALAAALAVSGGGPLTALVFDLVDRREPPSDSLMRAEKVLRGGTWIGALERATILATLVAGWPEGLALVLALKGLGRYPELRAAEAGGAPSGAAERFIIGTFTSVLWACSCAGVVALLLR